MAALGNTDGLRMKDLAAGMITTPSNVTRTSVAMERKGLVERRRSDQSDREVVARLTAKGEQLFERYFLVVVDFTRRFVDSGLSVDQQRQAAKLLRTFTETTVIPDGKLEGTLSG